MFTWSTRGALTLLLGLTLLVPVAHAGPNESGLRRLVSEAREVSLPEGQSLSYELGTLFVPENRGAQAGRTIGVGFARIRANPGVKGPPTFHLPGGPGGSYLDVFTEKSDWARAKRKELLAFRAVGDVVLVDQRGFSSRGDMLTYRHALARPMDQAADSARDAVLDKAEAGAVVAASADKDLAGYTVQACAEDVNDLRRALGYGRIILVGQSFGSQWSFAVMRLHPEIVERALLSGVEPLDYAYDMPSQVFSALQRIAWDADKDRGLKPYLPAGGLMAAVRAVHDRLAQGPVTVAVRDPVTGASQTVVLGLGDLQKSMLAPPDAWPALMISLYHGRYEAWARAVIAQRRSDAEVEAVIGPLIDTSLGVTPMRAHMMRSDPALGYLGDWNWASYIASQDVWPTPDAGDAFRTPTLSHIPVLFVNGDWDTSTPQENMLSVLPYFPNGRALLVHRGGHGARTRLAEVRPDVLTAIVKHLRTGEARGLPVSIALPPPDFKQPDFPPPVQVTP